MKGKGGGGDDDFDFDFENMDDIVFDLDWKEGDPTDADDDGFADFEEDDDEIVFDDDPFYDMLGERGGGGGGGCAPRGVPWVGLESEPGSASAAHASIAT